MNIPTVRQCLAYMDDFAMYDNIRAHSLMVARVASALLTGLERSERLVAPLPPASLVTAGALLHDIAKTPCLNSDCDHARMGGEICREHGYAEIAAIVEEHVRLRDFAPTRYREGRFTAPELVYYADKRVRHNVVVHLDERLEYIIDHYGRGNPVRHRLIQENFQSCLSLEEHLFRWLPFAPARLGAF